MNYSIRSLISFAVLAGCISLTGCASILNGPRQKVTVTTDPAGAIVSDGKNCWTTPATISLPRKQAHPLFISKAGYKIASVRLKQVASAAVLGNILLPGGFIGLGIDSLSGAHFKLVPDTLHIKLQSLKEEGHTEKKPVHHLIMEKLNEISGAIKTI